MRLRFLLIAMALWVAPVAFGGTYTLNDWCFYVNSLDVNRSCNNGSGVDNFNPPATSGTFDYVHLGDASSLGSATITLGPGTYNVFAIFNYDINNDGGAANGMNEFATVFGSLPVGQVYSVDTQGASGTTPGNLYAQFADGTLDNTNHVPGCSGSECPDVSVAMGYTNLVVPENTTAQVNFVIGDAPPSSGAYIQQGDNSVPSTINFSSNVEIIPDSSQNMGAIENPEPGTVLTMAGGVGLMLLGLRRRRKA